MEAAIEQPRVNPIVVGLLENVVCGAAGDAVAMGRALREVFERDPESFYAAILPAFRNAGRGHGSPRIASLLVSSGLVVQVLWGDRVSPGDAIQLARAALEIDPTLDIMLARRAAESAETERPEVIERILTILAAVSDGRRILRSLTVLLRRPDARVRSKAALLLGRAARNPRWVEQLLGEEDPRVRANAIEATWGMDSADIREILEAAARDPNNRVAGNALLALYRAGVTSTCPAILRMASDRRAEHRATAAWLIGEIKDPRFMPALARLMADQNSMVRRRAHLSLKRSRDVAPRESGAPDVALAIGAPVTAGEGWKRVQLAPAGDPNADSFHPTPTQLLLFEGNLPVYEYEVEPVDVPESIAVVILYPAHESPASAPWLSGLTGCLGQKRSEDRWSLAAYRETTAEEIEPAAILPRYYASAWALRERLCGAPPSVDKHPAPRTASTANGRPACPELVPGFWTAVTCAAAHDGATVRGTRHLLICNTAGRDRPGDLDAIVSSARARRLKIHAVSTVAAPDLEELCLETGGVFCGSVAESDLSERLRRVYALLLPRYTIRYRSQATGSRLRVQVRTPELRADGESM